jgi:aspartyl-tRNA(Asn)/glutamyl-tRNA(Gln) amidotransferase subunit C
LALGKKPSFPDVPAMPHSHIDVRYVANLARLELSDDEVATFQPQLEAILHHAEALSKLDVTGIEPTAHPAPVFGRMRDDTPHESLPRSRSAKCARPSPRPDPCPQSGHRRVI